LDTKQGKSRCHDHLAPTKQADFITPSKEEKGSRTFLREEWVAPDAPPPGTLVVP
jgi:hypothetical protein